MRVDLKFLSFMIDTFENYCGLILSRNYICNYTNLE